MKAIKLVFSALCLAAGLAILLPAAGCNSSTGATNTLGTYSVLLDASPDRVTRAAESACKDLKLVAIAAASTKIDGRVTARTAQNEEITINVEQKGDNVSEMRVRVGVTGDESTTKQIIDKTKANLH